MAGPHDTYQRYAIYFAPEPGSRLAAFGNGWLGIDPASGQSVPPLQVPAISMDERSQLIQAPARYGFHGTLKPPFALAEGKDEAALSQAVENLAGTIKGFTLPPFQLRALGNFIALMPAMDSAPLADLAAACVRQLDDFRGPQSAAMIARRRQAGLSQRQESLLQSWGYPYVMEEFRFHLTLTGKCPPDQMPRLLASLQDAATAACAEPVAVTSICLFGEGADDRPDEKGKAGAFRLIRRFQLKA